MMTVLPVFMSLTERLLFSAANTPSTGSLYPLIACLNNAVKRECSNVLFVLCAL